MKKTAILLFTILLAVSQTSWSASTEEIKNVDVCVYGGTACGVIAAYSAKMMGKSVVLVEPGKYLGGMTTGGLGSTDIGNKYAVTGLSRLFYRRVGEHYNKFEQWAFPPSVATRVINRYVSDAKLDVLYQYRIISTKKNGTTIESVRLENSTGADKNIVIAAKQFIDCSYEGDLMARSGVSYIVGREGNEVYDETLDGVQLSHNHQFANGIDPYIKEGDPSSGLLWGISNNKLASKGSGDTLVQAYNFRLCLTTVKENQVPFTKPKNYDPSRYVLLARALKIMDNNIRRFLLYWDGMPEKKYDVNNCGPLSTDMIGMNHNYPDGDYATREKIWQDHIDYTKGLMYFMTHDKSVPEQFRDDVSKFGWTKDEFVDNDNFPTQLYVREARRMIGEYVMTQHNCQGDETVGDGIGMAAYGMDSHNCQRIVINGMVKNEGDVEYGGFPPYPISYKSITPKTRECTNLLVPVCMSASHIAYGSIRMEPVFMVLGESAGVAACMAIDQKSTVQSIDVTKLRRKLKDDPYLDGSTPEVLTDDADIDKISTNGSWEKRFGQQYKTSYMLSENKDGKSTFTFFPQVKKNGEYEVFFYCTEIANAPSSIDIEVTNDKSTNRVTIAPKEHKGEWVNLGTYSFNVNDKNGIKVNGSNANGPIFADAVILRPKK